MIFYDFEVFKYDWLAVFIDMATQEKHVIVNDRQALVDLYNKNVKNIWVGFNIKHYDQYIFKGIMLGMDPKVINDDIIIREKEGWAISKEFSKIPMILYDVFGSRGFGLKTLEGFMGSNIKETDVPFNIDRKLTPEEIQMSIKYCTHDVEETIKVFMERINDFNSQYDLVKVFDLPLSCLGDSGAHVVSKVLGCERNKYEDEFDFYVLPHIRINKYRDVIDWFNSIRGNPENLSHKDYYSRNYITTVAGIPHTFGFGGLHGAPGIIKVNKKGEKSIDSTPKHYKGSLFHVDVNNYYPSILIAHNLVTRSATNNKYAEIYETRRQLKMKQLAAETKEEAKKYKKMQLPYKQLLNALSGAMKDKNNKAYDPRNNNLMCMNGQLMLLDLIEHLEVIEGFVLVQSNTDGLIVQIPDTEEAFNQLDDICYDWETRCSTDLCGITLATDQIREVYQKDVNNYLWIDIDGEVERRGAYLKELSTLDYDLPIVNEALVKYMVDKIPLQDTIYGCKDLIKFQKLVKLSDAYEYVEYNGKRYDYKCYRVFASKEVSDGKILKVKKKPLKARGEDGKMHPTGETTYVGEKFANSPDHCFIYNEDVRDVKVPDKLDYRWYLDLARERIKDFGL